MKPTPAIVSSSINVAKIEKLDAQIDKLESSFIDVGRLLDAMRREFPSSDKFEVHCYKVRGWSPSTIYEKIQAAEIAVRLRKFGTLPTKETAMQLASLGEEDQVKAWRKAIDTARGRITAAHVAKCVEAVIGRPPDAAPGECSDLARAAFDALPPTAKLAAMQRDQEAAKASRPTARESGRSTDAEIVGAILRHALAQTKLIDQWTGDRDFAIERLTGFLAVFGEGLPKRRAA
jgi:hypothetical protein